MKINIKKGVKMMTPRKEDEVKKHLKMTPKKMCKIHDTIKRVELLSDIIL